MMLEKQCENSGRMAGTLDSVIAEPSSVVGQAAMPTTSPRKLLVRIAGLVVTEGTLKQSLHVESLDWFRL